ncbi:hypothetical protein EW146_g6460 [Bondarzewia mesenterica]|uniref:lipoate--protein ligase n=1 Tax=Bondarzewia mesenterica TaxID=1095465 RepID=A0A4S4LPE4_9AGAM|nr:hypothetical protein EW146_g6460 [Bondarzewia mesenterica]
MLISTRLDTLGDVLHPTKDSMVTRGVASIRSPVRNLNEFQPHLLHDEFVHEVVQAFRDEYDVHEPVQSVTYDADTMNIDEIRHGMAELPSWNWAFGQTPEFTYKIGRKFPWGDVTAEIHSRHGIILSCKLTTEESTVQSSLEELGKALRDQKYGSIDCGPLNMKGQPMTDVIEWLVEEMST